MMLRIDRHAANLLDFAASDRLSIGHQRQGLEQRARIFGRPLLPQPRYRLSHRSSDLNSIAARDFEQFQSARFVLRRKRGDRGSDFLGI